MTYTADRATIVSSAATASIFFSAKAEATASQVGRITTTSMEARVRTASPEAQATTFSRADRGVTGSPEEQGPTLSYSRAARPESPARAQTRSPIGAQPP